MSTETEGKTIAEEAVQNVRPLNATQGRNLLAIVKGDFEILELEMRNFSEEKLAEKQKQIRQESNAAKQDEFKDKAQKLLEKQRQARLDLVSDARRVGITLSFSNTSIGSVEVRDDEMNQKINSAAREAKRELDHALNILRKEQLAAERQVLKATITAQAENILESIPTAQQMMINAAAEREAQRKAIGG